MFSDLPQIFNKEINIIAKKFLSYPQAVACSTRIIPYSAIIIP
jgi:hypothetical protein